MDVEVSKPLPEKTPDGGVMLSLVDPPRKAPFR